MLTGAADMDAGERKLVGGTRERTGGGGLPDDGADELLDDASPAILSGGPSSDTFPMMVIAFRWRHTFSIKEARTLNHGLFRRGSHTERGFETCRHRDQRRRPRDERSAISLHLGQ